MTCVIIVASKDKTIALCDILYLFSKIFSVISRFQLVALEYTKLAAAFHNNHVKYNYVSKNPYTIVIIQSSFKYTD